MENKSLSLIRSKVIEANPEIVELKFDERDEGKRFYRTFDEERVFVIPRNGYPSSGNVIIGRPIRLADVLLAIRAAMKDFGVDSRGAFLEGDGTRIGKNGNGYGYFPEWNLRNDDLEKNPQVWDFLAEILK